MSKNTMRNITKDDIQQNLTPSGKIQRRFLKKYDLSIQQCFNTLNDFQESPICPICGDKPRRFVSLNKGYAEYCGRNCSNSGKWNNKSIESGNKKRKEFWKNNPEYKLQKDLKISKTNSIAWGSGTLLRTEQIKKVKDGSGFKEIYKKGRKTKISKYGHAFDFQCESQRNRMIELYGVDNARLIFGMSERIRQTFIERYGVSNSIDLPGVRKKSLETKMKNYLNKIEDLDDLSQYYKKVWFFTNRQPISTLKNSDKRSRADLNINAYHLDHKFSIIEGFMKNIPPVYLGNINNIEMIPWKENVSKRNRCSITIDELIEGYVSDTRK